MDPHFNWAYSRSFIRFLHCLFQKHTELLIESPETVGESINIALYSDSGASETSVWALKAMFQWINHTVILVDADHINNKGLSGFSILCVLGGDMYQYSRSISLRGKENIRVFIRRGGGYIGVCGGAYFASERVVWQGRQLPRLLSGFSLGKPRGHQMRSFLIPIIRYVSVT